MKQSLNAKTLDAMGKPHKPIKYGDVQVKNLIALLAVSGKIYWKWQGRVNGKVVEIALGQYPAMGVGEARKAADKITEARDLAKMKGETFEVPRLRKSNTISVPNAVPAPTRSERDCDWLWDEYMKREGGGKASSVEKQRCWDKDIKPFIGHKPYAEITFDDLADIIATKAEAAPGAANHLVAYIKRLFRWAVTKGRPFTKLEIDPSEHLVKPTETKVLDRFLDQQEIIWFFKTADVIGDTFCEALTLTLYNGTRRDESFDMPWKEYDENSGYWTIPKERAKNGDELLLPLADTSQALLKARRKHSGKGTYVFPSSTGDKPISGFSKAMKAFRKRMAEIAAEDTGSPAEIPNWTIHDLRRTVSTGMNGLLDAEGNPLIPENIVERVLNHRLAKMKRTYNKHEHLVEKKKALMLWGEHLDGLRTQALLPAMKVAA